MCDDQKSLQNINYGCLLESLEDSYFLVFVFGSRTLRFLDCLFLGLERSPSPGFVRDCWCPVPCLPPISPMEGAINSCPSWTQLPYCLFRLPDSLDKTSRQSPAHIAVSEALNSQVNSQQLSSTDCVVGGYVHVYLGEWGVPFPEHLIFCSLCAKNYTSMFPHLPLQHAC